MSGVIRARIGGFIAEVEAFQRELDNIKNPPRTFIQDIVEEGAKDLPPKALGELAAGIMKSIGLPGTSARRYVSKATRKQIKRNQQEQVKTLRDTIGLRVDYLLDGIIEFFSNVSTLKSSLTIQGNSAELVRKFAKVKSLKRPDSKARSVLSTLKEIEHYRLIENSQIPEMLPKLKQEKQVIEPAYDVLKEFETRFREFIQRKLQQASPNWWEERISNGIRKKAEKRRQNDEVLWAWHNQKGIHPVHFLDFKDYAQIITEDNNWNTVFKGVFKDKDSLSLRLKMLEPIRNAIAHSRELTKEEYEELQVFTREVIRLIEGR